jgi:REP element-mobilizing transposase RayT
VTVTKYRADILTDERLERVAEVAHEIADDFEAVIQNVDGGTDHVHILFTTKPTTDLTKFIRSRCESTASIRRGWAVNGASASGLRRSSITIISSDRIKHSMNARQLRRKTRQCRNTFTLTRIEY